MPPCYTQAMKIVVLGNQGRSMVNFWSVLVRHLLTAGHEVCCMLPPGDSEADASLTALGTRVLHYPLDRKGLNPLRDCATMRALLVLLRQEKPDLLFTSTIKPVIYGCLAARLAGVPHVYATITGLGYAFEADSFFKKCVNHLGVLLYRLALSGVEGVFFQNRDDLATFREAGILGSIARVLFARGVGVDIQRFAEAPLPPMDTPTFLLVGRLLEAKGLYEYAAAAKLLKARWPQARFQVLGPPEQGLGSVPMEQMRAWQDAGDIEYLGETRDVRPHVAACHVLVLPSWREGTPTSVMEAMSMGRPAVVTDVPGCREVVQDGVNGRLCHVRDPQDLGRAMEHFLEHPDDMVRMGAAGRDLAEREFAADLVASRIMADMHLPAAQKERT